MKPILIRTFLFLILSALLTYCANIVSPAGGARDTVPPKVVKSNPPIGVTNFTGGKIVIQFDEFIQLRDLYSQLLVSPLINVDPIVKTNNKKLIITIKDSLRENTTYSIYFGDAIADITESNKISGFRYVFSTGEYIDSLQLGGKIRLAKDESVEKDLKVMLYPGDSEDSVPLKSKPLYVASAQENGNFVFRNLAPGNYRIFALKDLNQNFMYDIPGELIGFLDTLVIPWFPPVKDTAIADSLQDLKVPEINLLLFKEEDSVQRLVRGSMTEENHLTLVFRYPVNSVQLVAQTKRDTVPAMIEDYNSARDTLHLWFNSPAGDSLKVYIYADSLLTDTLEISALYRARKGTPTFADHKHLPLKSNVLQKTLPFFSPLVIESPRPIKGFELDRIILCVEKDSLYDTIALSASQFQLSGVKTLLINYDWKQNTTYNLLLQPGAISDIYSLENDTLELKFKTTTPETYGTFRLKVNIKGESANYILELIQSDNKVFHTKILNASQTYEIPNIPPGKYHLRCVYDRNGNGRWDTGSYLKGIQPERTTFLLRDIQINANWELENEIKID
jgi:uncharacterized protein (DUF2141 family)